MLRLDPAQTPTKFRCCTVSQQELRDLRTIADVMRLGRIQSIGTEEIVLANGTVPVDAGTLYIDCTANGLSRRDPMPIFSDKKITLQSVVWCTYVFSASATAKVEISCGSDAEKNQILHPVCHPESLEDRFVAIPEVEGNGARMREHFPEFMATTRLLNVAPAGWEPSVRSLPYGQPLASAP